MLAGVAGWFALADRDYQYRYVETEDRYPRYEGDLGYYDSLSPGERAVVDRAMAGGTPRLESRANLPPDVIERDGDYLVFRGYSYFDWTNPRTFGPTGIGLLGFGMVVLAVRKDVRDRGVH
ncbi:hypothetical protein ACFQE8_20195 [Salinirubellus sp. GCM10025818]